MPPRTAPPGQPAKTASTSSSAEPSLKSRPPLPSLRTADASTALVDAHLQDVLQIVSEPPNPLTDRPQRSVPAAILFFAFRNISSWCSTLFFAPATLFAAPTETMIGLLVYPFVWLLLGDLALLVYFYSRLRGKPWIEVSQSLSRWAVKDWSMSKSEEVPDFTSLRTIRIFSLPLARAFLLMSSLVYERADNFVQDAAKLVTRARRSQISADAYERELKRARDLLQASEQRIRDQASGWGVAFNGVSELASVGGSFASIFYTPFGRSEEPFIVLVFKGTTPTQFADFIVDATATRTDASVFFSSGSGSVHQGFYSSRSILRTLQYVAAQYKHERSDKKLKVPLWVTDCYVFGTPRIGDGAFASAFEQTLVTPLDRSHILWRVANDRDPVTHLPFGIADAEPARSVLPSRSVLDYAFLGPAIRLVPAAGFEAPTRYRVEGAGAFHELTEVRVEDAEAGGKGGGSGQAGEMSGWEQWRSRTERWTVAGGYAGRVSPWLPGKVRQALHDHYPVAYLNRLNTVETTAERDARERDDQHLRALTDAREGRSRLSGAGEEKGTEKEAVLGEVAEREEGAKRG
ncbi:hypothetical protein JCM8097_001655 [Rhodosporidiobolus ruineniae]